MHISPSGIVLSPHPGPGQFCITFPLFLPPSLSFSLLSSLSPSLPLSPPFPPPPPPPPPPPSAVQVTVQCISHMRQLFCFLKVSVLTFALYCVALSPQMCESYQYVYADGAVHTHAVILIQVACFGALHTMLKGAYNSG